MTWHEDNQRHLLAHVARVRRALAGETPTPDGPAAAPPERPFALERLIAAFGLSAFERDVLVGCAAAELDDAGSSATPFTVGRALSALAEAHWSAFSPDAPLRRWLLVELAGGSSFTTRRLVLDERILHDLLGVDALDQRLVSAFDPLPAGAPGSAAQRRAVSSAVARLTDADGPTPVVHLDGDVTSAREVAAGIGSALGAAVWSAAFSSLPTGDLHMLARLLERESAIDGTVLLLVADDAEPQQATAAVRLASLTAGPVLLAGPRPRELAGRPVVSVAVGGLTVAERAAAWRSAVGERAALLNGEIDDLAHAFPVSTDTVGRAAARARLDLDDGLPPVESLRRAVRAETRGALEGLAQHIEPTARWGDLVLPETQRATLEELASHVRHRRLVHEEWGFRARSARGLAVTALFSGPSGTGKTMAAEVLANELGFDLYRIDLSATVSKYIGETEKNLRVLFDRAEEAAAVLLFDEADALFGRRSEVHDAHDRHANIEVSYLLQRMETYRGLAILTTNLPDHLDDAFLRRLRYVVPFPFPDATARAEIWRQAFPSRTPLAGLDLDALARLNVSGGSITNIAVGAAALAAATGGPVTMAHLLRAVRTEYAKLAKPLSATELRGWDLEAVRQ